MKTFLTICVLLLSVIVATGGSQTKPQQWEYKLDDKCHEKKINDLAAQGWDLITIDSFTYSNVTGLTCAFRRSK